MTQPPQKDFAMLLATHDRELLRYIMMLIPRRDDAEEVLQRTAIVLWEKFGEYDQSRAFLPWANRVAYFEVLNFRKEQARNRLVFAADVVALLAESRNAHQGELDRRRTALRQCLQQLSQQDRSLLERRYNDSSTIKTLAVERGRTVKALYRRLDRVRDQIQNCVEQRVGILNNA